MTENLRASEDRNGNQISNITGNTEWGNLTTGAWGYYENDASNNAAYGKLYNWHAFVIECGLCPMGWHVPSVEI
jgi:uncharacterized protein (TIGR02145 family)